MKKVFLATAGSLFLLAGCNNNVNNTVSPGTSSVSGRVASETDAGLSGRTVFVDTNSNNQRDPGEPTTTTGVDGAYSIASVPSGTFRVAVELEDGEELASTDSDSRSARIVGGTDVPQGKYPWMVAVLKDGDVNCGGTLIRSNWVLTAAHCFYADGSNTQLDVTEANTSVRIGDVGFNQGQEFNVVEIIHHPNYEAVPTFSNDVTLLRLASPVPNTVTIPFATNDSQFEGIMASTAIGWGATSFRGRPPAILQEVNLPLLTNTQCNELLAIPDSEGLTGGQVTDVMICAGRPEGGIDSCQGDSGGPLIVNTSNGPLQVGITSFGVGCAFPNRPGVYARTSAPVITNFINANLPAAPTPTTAPTATPTATPTAAPTAVPTATPAPVPTPALSEPITFAPGQPQTVNFRIRRR